MPSSEGDAAARRSTRLHALRARSALDQGEHALFVEGSLRGSRSWFDHAYREGELAGCSQSMTRAALGMGGLWVHERRLAAEAAAVQARQRRALARVGVESILGRRLKARLAAEHSYQTGDPSGVLGVLEGQRCLDDPVALAEAISLAHHCLLGPDHAQQRLDLAHELLTAAALSARPIDLLMGLLWRTVDLFLLGDPTAERSLSELRSALTAGGHLACRFVLASLDGMLAVRAGRWADAEALVAKAADLGTAAGDADAVTWQAAQLFAIRWFQGRIPEMLSELTQLAASPSTGVIDRSSYAAVGLTLAVCADRAAAACALARVRGSGFDNLVRSSTWLVTMYGVVETAYLLDDLDTAAEAYGVLRAYAGLPMMTSLAVACYGSTEHSLGTAALTLGDTEAAVRHLRAAIRANQALGHHPAAALSTARLGHALMLRAGGEDAQRAAREGTAPAKPPRAWACCCPCGIPKPSVSERVPPPVCG